MSLAAFDVRCLSRTSTPQIREMIFPIRPLGVTSRNLRFECLLQTPLTTTSTTTSLRIPIRVLPLLAITSHTGHTSVFEL
eukprot:2491091-Rhodomonas_salina.1